MLILTRALLDEVIAHVREAHPVEACGILAGFPRPAPRAPIGPTRLIRMHNALDSETAYQFDPAEQLAAYRQMDARGEDPLAIYHSHTASEAVPSGIDTRFALDPDAVYLIVSTMETEPVLRAWRIFPAVAHLIDPWIEEPIEIV